MDETTQRDAGERKLEGIGGWLILAAIGLVASPVLMVVNLTRDILPAFAGGAWDKLTTAGSPHYHPLWAPLLITEVSCTILLILFSLVILCLFFMKKKQAPLFIIIFLLANLVFVIADYSLSMRIPLVASMPDESTPTNILRQAISCALWVPYFLRSKRVKNTFVK